MKKTTKKIKTEIEIFIADDGTEFTEEWKCIEYESKQVVEKYKQFILDDNAEMALPEDAFFMKIINKDMHREINDYFNRNKYTCEILELKEYPSVVASLENGNFKEINFLKSFFK